MKLALNKDYHQYSSRLDAKASQEWFRYRRLLWAVVSMLFANTAMAVDQPGWWYDPSPGVGGLVYEKGSSEKCSTESEARQVAWDNALAEIRKGITDETNFWPRIHLVGTDIAHNETRKDAFILYGSIYSQQALGTGNDITITLNMALAKVANGITVWSDSASLRKVVGR